MPYILIIALLAAALPARAEHKDHDGDHHVAHLEGLVIEHAWIAATEDDHTLVYMTVENEAADQVEIVGAEASIAQNAQLVGFTLSGADVIYEPLPSVTVASGNHLELSPDGLAIALSGIEGDLVEGEEFEMELHTSLGHLDFHVQIEPKGARQHSHAGHNH